MLKTTHEAFYPVNRKSICYQQTGDFYFGLGLLSFIEPVEFIYMYVPIRVYFR